MNPWTGLIVTKPTRSKLRDRELAAARSRKYYRKHKKRLKAKEKLRNQKRKEYFKARDKTRKSYFAQWQKKFRQKITVAKIKLKLWRRKNGRQARFK